MNGPAHGTIHGAAGSASPADEALDSLAVLADPVRRRLYRFVAPQAEAVGRDEAAQAAGISRPLAAFHLDRLVAAGLLDVEYRRRSGRTGPGAGRPAKLYRRSSQAISLSVPERHYELAAGLFAEALDASEAVSDPARTCLSAAAARLGRQLAGRSREVAGPRPSQKGLRAAMEATLVDSGYEPRHEADGSIRVANCPFDTLAKSHRDLTCGMNLSIMESLLDDLGVRGMHAELDPQPGLCCIAFRKGPPEEEHADRVPAAGRANGAGAEEHDEAPERRGPARKP